MRGLKNMLLAEETRLEKIVHHAKQQLINFLEGSFRFSKKQGVLSILSLYR